MYLDPEAMTQTVPERVPKTTGGEGISGYGIGLLAGHPGRNQCPGTLVRFLHRSVNFPLPLGRPADDNGSRNVGAVTLENGSEIQQHEVSGRNRTSPCPGVR